jgi:hypothetical protein
MTKDFFTDSGITHNVFVVKGVELASAALKSVFVVKSFFLFFAIIRLTALK